MRRSSSRVGLSARSFSLLALALIAVPLDPRFPASAATLPSGFQESVVLTGLTEPTAMRFSPDGRVFVIEKGGQVKVFDSLSDPTATVYADLRTKVHSHDDRGMLGLALDPNFPTVPDIFVAYAHDAAIGGTAPRWGTAGANSDPCPTPPGPTIDGCVISSRLSRLSPASGGGGSYRDAVLADSPAGYWRLGETSGTTAADTSGNGRTGSYLNTPTLGQAGALTGDSNTSVGFDGTSEHVSVPYSGALNTASTSLEAWVYPTGGQGQFRAVVSNRDYVVGSTRGSILYASSLEHVAVLARQRIRGVDRGRRPGRHPESLDASRRHLRRRDGPALCGRHAGRVGRVRAHAQSVPAAPGGRGCQRAGGRLSAARAHRRGGRLSGCAQRDEGQGSLRCCGGLVRVGNRRERPDRGLVPAVHHGLGGRSRVRAGGRAVHDRGRRRELPLHRLRAAGATAEPLRRPAGWCRRDAQSADLGGRVAPQPGPAHAGDPVGLGGTLIRVDRATGQGMPNNPNAGNPDPNTRRIVAYGLRNPFRIGVRPGTRDVWIGDVGAGTFEEINRVPDAIGPVRNFGWPCYEGELRSSGFDAADLDDLREPLRTVRATTLPFFRYQHGQKVVPTETCSTTTGSAVSGFAFTPANSTFPASYDNALFFADYSRRCIWVMFPDGSGIPNPATVTPSSRTPPTRSISSSAPTEPVLRRRRHGKDPPYLVPRRQPAARCGCDGRTGQRRDPLVVNFNGSGSSDPDGRSPPTRGTSTQTEQYDDSTAQNPSCTYTSAGTYAVRLRVTDNLGAQDVSDRSRSLRGAARRTRSSTAPSSFTWRAGDVIAFSGHGTARKTVRFLRPAYAGT